MTVKRRFSLVVDATCDIPREILEQNRVGIIDIIYRFGEDTYTSDPTAPNHMDMNEFYTALEEKSVFPKTAAPSPRAMAETIKKAGDLPVLVMTVSGELSALHSTAKLAARASRRDAIVYDTRNVSIGFGLLALGVIDLMNKGATREEAIEWLDAHKDKVRVYAYLDTLEYVIRGGRLSRTKGAIGNLLGIRPIVEVRDGRVLGEKKAKKGRGCERILELVEEDYQPGRKIYAVVAFATYTPEYEKLKSELKERYDIGVLQESRLGVIVGCHIGPKGFGIAYYFE